MHGVCGFGFEAKYGFDRAWLFYFISEGYKRHMDLDLAFFLNSILFGAGLAMDAFSVSVANGLNEPAMKTVKMCGVAGIFSAFQFAMPMVGWICVSTVAQRFEAFKTFIPWIALVLLCFIGGKMIVENIRQSDEAEEKPAVGLAALLVQGVATSIDALSVGFTIADYSWLKALLACLLIGAVTFIICLAGILIGKKAGTQLAGKAGIFGGAILVFIGLEIFITSWF